MRKERCDLCDREISGKQDRCCKAMFLDDTIAVTAQDCQERRYRIDERTVPRLRAALEEALDLFATWGDASGPDSREAEARAAELRKLVDEVATGSSAGSPSDAAASATGDRDG